MIISFCALWAKIEKKRKYTFPISMTFIVNAYSDMKLKTKQLVFYLN